MNHIEFIEKHVREELIKQGFTLAVAQGGHFRQSICTSVCLRPVVRGGFLMMCYVTQSYGPRSNRRLPISSQNAGLNGMSSKQGCSEMVKTVVRQHSRSSGANTSDNCGISMPNQNMFCQRAGKRLDKSTLNRSSGGLNGRGLDKNANVVGHQPEGERHCSNTGAVNGGGKNANK